MKHMITRALIIALVIAAFITAAFGQRSDKLSTERWRLTELNGVRFSNSNAYFELNNNRNRFTGNTGCNQMFGAVSVTGRQIRFTKIGTTRMACSRAANLVESEVLKALQRVTKYRQSGDRLELYQRGRVIMRLTAIVREVPDDGKAGLNDRKWVLQQIGNQVNIRALPEALINFDPVKKGVGGNSSCNLFGGSYETRAGGRIRITDVVSTMRACVDDSRMNVERALFDGLRDANRVEIRDGMLRLYHDRRLLLTFRGERKI